MPETVAPFELDIPQGALDRLRSRLDDVRWPEAETVDDWSQGVPLNRLQPLIEYWRTAYDWRRCEAMLNRFGQFRTELDGLNIHFIHRRSPHPGALPLLMTHGWPGSVIEFHKVIDPLVDPVAFGDQAADAFDVVVPSLPGYGFSDKPGRTGWSAEHIARVWHRLMHRLGYGRYIAQGGDWGSIVTTRMGHQAPEGLAAIHLNMPIVGPDPDAPEFDADEKAARERGKIFAQQGLGYAILQSTRPQTLGYALADSPVGQAAWIYEKFHAWSDCGGDPESVLARDEILDNIMLYWLTNSGASAGRFYWESFESARRPVSVDIPVGCSIFPGEISQPPRKWAERSFSDIIYWNKMEKGGHFAAFEQPDAFVQELRKFARLIR